MSEVLAVTPCGLFSLNVKHKRTTGESYSPPSPPHTHHNNILKRPAKILPTARWEKGEGRLLPEFQCHRDLYEHKLRQQEALSKQLRRQQRSIKENEGAVTRTSARSGFSCSITDKCLRVADLSQT